MASRKKKENPFDNAYGIKVKEEELNNYIKRQNSKKVNEIFDLSELETRTEEELLKTLSYMIQNKKFFKYCASLLININPGPNYINDYLNLQLWTKQTEQTKINQWAPHLYSFMYYVYQTMITDKKDQVVNLLGQIGSGKTFCIIHIIEYFCSMICPETQQIEVFDIIHKSIQLVHMVGSIFRENNIESSSCGMLFRLGFGDENILSSFDIEAKILDYTLPFSENGRSFSILHGFMAGATSDLKRKFDLPENEHSLNFFRKFNKTFSERTKERFKLNDLEIWNRFHSLLKQFNFTKDEVIEILQVLSFVLNLNEVNISKNKGGTKLNNSDQYKINSGITSKKLSKAMNMDEKEFINASGAFSTSEEAKLFIVALVKYSYHMLFEFILKKVKLHLRNYFKQHSFNVNNIKATGKEIKMINTDDMKKSDNVRYINFIDFPGEVNDQTLGGFTTNISNECLNMISATSYFSVIEKLLNESVILKQFQPLQSYSVIQSAFGDKGIFDYLSHPLTEENFNEMKEAVKCGKHLANCLKFNKESSTRGHECEFSFVFSHKIIQYNYETLYNETKSFSFGKRIYELFSKAKNCVVTSTYQTVINIDSDFYSLYSSHLMRLLRPIENIRPFVIYNLHSNTSYKIFFSKDDQILNESDLNEEIPNELTIEMLKQSLAFPVLNWNWYGFKEWMEHDTMIKEYTIDLEKVKTIILSSKNNFKIKDELIVIKNIKLNDLTPIDMIKYTMDVLSREGDYIIGKHFVIMKKGTLARMRSSLNSMIKLSKEINIKDKEKENKKHSLIGTKTKMSSSSLLKQESNKKLLSKCNSKNKGYSSSNVNSHNKNSFNKMPTISDIQLKENSDLLVNSNNNLNNNKESEEAIFEEKQFKLINDNTSRQHFLKEQCVLNIIEDNHIINNTKPNTIIKCDKYNVFSFIDKTSRDNNRKAKAFANTCSYANQTSKDISLENSRINSSIVKTHQSIKTTGANSNIVVPHKQHFITIRNSLDPNKNKNFSIFDYNEITPQVLLIQKNFRALLSKMLIRRMQFVYSQIVIIQSFSRGFITRLKMQRFMNCLRKVKLIQRVFRKKLISVNTCVIRIQSLYRGHRRRMRTKMRLKEKKIAISKGEMYMYLSTEEEDKANKRKVDISNVHKHKQKQDLGTINSDQISNAINRKIIKSIENETNPDMIIKALLLDKRLLNANNDFNQLAINSDGIEPLLRNQILERLYHNKINPKQNVNNSIVDRLINQGSILKQKRAQEQFAKNKEEEKNLTFKPNINSNKYNNNKSGPGFLVRNELYKQEKERNIENIRNKYKMKEEAFTYKPNITNNCGLTIQRDFRRLYNLEKIRSKRDYPSNRMKNSQDESSVIEVGNIKSSKEIEENKNYKKAINYYDKYDLYKKDDDDDQENIDMSDIWPMTFNKEFTEPIQLHKVISQRKQNDMN